MGRTAQTASQTAKKSKKEKRAKEGNDDRSEKRAKVSKDDKEDKKRRELIRLMCDWEPDYKPEDLEKMTNSEMEKILDEELSDGEEIDPDDEKAMYDYKGKKYTSRELNNEFHREAYEANKSWCSYTKGKNKKKEGEKKARGAPPKANPWQRFLATNRTSLSPKTYKQYIEAEGFSREQQVKPVLFTKVSGEKVLKVLEISKNDDNLRWAETGMEFDEAMEQGEDYM